MGITVQPGLFPAPPRPATAWKPPETLPELGRFPRLWMDTEATSNDPHRAKPVGISLATADGKKYYLPWGHLGGGNLDEGLVKRWAERELRDKDLVFINTKYDNHVLYRWDLDLEKQGCRLHDVAFQAALLDERRYQFNLDLLCKDFLNMDGAKLNLGGLPISKDPIHERSAGEIGPYAEQDADLVRQLDERMLPEIKEQDLGRVLDLEDALIYSTCEMERNGAPLDVPKLRTWRVEVSRRYEQAILEIHRQAKVRVNPQSPDDLLRLFKALNLPLRGMTAQGKASFAEEHLLRVQHPTVQLVIYARRLSSLKSKYLDPYYEAVLRDGVLRYSLHQLRTSGYGTVTGRYAAAEKNIQQVMKVERQVDELGPDFIIRELFIPGPGAVWLSADASQIEFRLFAHYSGAKDLIAAYQTNPDVDFHQLVCDMIRQILPDFKRRDAKTINFGRLYGMGRAKLQRSLGVSEGKSNRIFDAYDEMFPQARRLLARASRLAQKRGYVHTTLGRRRRYQGEEDERFHSALNAVIQGSAADVMKLKILEIYRERKRMEHVMRFPVHDEHNGDMLNPDRTTEMKELLNSPVLPLRVPILWNTETGPNWAMR